MFELAEDVTPSQPTVATQTLGRSSIDKIQRLKKNNQNPD